MSITDPMILNTSLLRAEILCGKGFDMSEVLSMFYKKLQNKKKCRLCLIIIPGVPNNKDWSPQGRGLQSLR